jgi:hypothetical protein
MGDNGGTGAAGDGESSLFASPNNSSNTVDISGKQTYVNTKLRLTEMLTFCEAAMLISDARVSTDNQKPDLLKDVLAGAGCDLIRLKLSRFPDKRKEVSE